MANIQDLRKYFGENVPVTVTEFKLFWESLTDEEKDSYKAQMDEIMGSN